MAITPLPTPPSRNDPANFAERGDAFLAALPTFATEANDLQQDVNQKQAAASQDAQTASTKAGEASDSALQAGQHKQAAEAAASAAAESVGQAASEAYAASLHKQSAEQAAATATERAASIDPSTLVRKSGNETIDGVKTFSSSPVIPDVAAGTSNGQAANTKFVQTAVVDPSSVADATKDRGVSKLLRWKVYGNNHAIIDASAGTGYNGRAINNTNPDVGWNPAYPTLMGDNGTNTYGVRVDRARFAEALTTTSGAAPAYAARAWVNFNGTGAVSIRASGNVSSITDNGVGDYTVNFTEAMPHAAYSIALSLNSPGTTNTTRVFTVAGDDASGAVLKTGWAVRVISGASSTNSKIDCAELNVAIFC